MLKNKLIRRLFVKDDKNYKECLKLLLTGLKCENVDEFVQLCKPKDCERLGGRYYNLAKLYKDKLNKKS